MFCKNCGKELKDTAKFCPACGTQVEAGMNEKNASKQQLTGNNYFKPIIAIACVVVIAVIAIVVIMSKSSGGSSQIAEEITQNDIEESTVPDSKDDDPTRKVYDDSKVPFYGIWVYASKDLSEATEFGYKVLEAGFSPDIFLSSQWDNLNPEPYYVVSARIYDTEDAAKMELEDIKKAGFEGAYIKFSGYYKEDN